MKAGEVWLVPFPFTDQSGAKLRPALILSKSSHNQGSDSVIMCSVTTNPNRKSVPLQEKDLSSGKLYENCYAAYDTVFTLNRKLATKRIFVLNPEAMEKIKEGLLSILF